MLDHRCRWIWWKYLAEYILRKVLQLKYMDFIGALVILPFKKKYKSKVSLSKVNLNNFNNLKKNWY